MQIEYLSAASGGQRNLATPVTQDQPLPVGGATDNGATITSGVAVGGKMDSTAGGVSAGTTGRFGMLLLDLARRLIIKPLGGNFSHVTGNVSTNGATNVALIAAQGATNKVDLQSLTIANRDTVAHTLDLIDNATIVETVVLAAGDSKQLNWPAGRPSAAVNTAWNVVLREAHTTNPVVVSGSGYRTTG